MTILSQKFVSEKVNHQRINRDNKNQQLLLLVWIKKLIFTPCVQNRPTVQANQILISWGIIQILKLLAVGRNNWRLYSAVRSSHQLLNKQWKRTKKGYNYCSIFLPFLLYSYFMHTCHLKIYFIERKNSHYRKQREFKIVNLLPSLLTKKKKKLQWINSKILSWKIKKRAIYKKYELN